MAREKERSLEAKRKLLAEKEAHSVIVRQEMERKNHERVSSILGVAQRKEESMARTANEREWQNMIKKEQEALKREEKIETVQRIARAQEYKKKMILACLTQFKPKLKELIHRKLILPLSLWIKKDMIKSKT